MAEDHHRAQRARSLLPLQRFHLRRRDHARTQLPRTHRTRPSIAARDGRNICSWAIVDHLCWRNQKSAQRRKRFNQLGYATTMSGVTGPVATLYSDASFGALVRRKASDLGISRFKRVQGLAPIA